jgi:predicted transporter
LIASLAGGEKEGIMPRLRSLGYSLLIVLASVSPALAQSADVSKVQNFAQNVIQVLVTIAGLLAAGFFVMGGIGYITSSGNPENLDRSKKILVYSSIGLAICIGALVLSGIVSDLANQSFR